MSLRVYPPPPPPTLNALDYAQKARLIRSTRKLGAVLGITPYFLEQQQAATTRQLLPIRSSISPSRSNSQKHPQTTTVSPPTHRKSVSYPSPEASFLDFSSSSRPSTATGDEPPANPKPPSPKKLKSKPRPKPHALDLRISPSSARPCLNIPDPGSSLLRPAPSPPLTYHRGPLSPETPSFTTFPETPITPLTPVVTKADLKKRRVQKLSRYLGENVPPELVLLEAPRNSTQDPPSSTYSDSGDDDDPDYAQTPSNRESMAPSPTLSRRSTFISRIPKQRPVIPIFVPPAQQQQHCLPVLTPSFPMAPRNHSPSLHRTLSRNSLLTYRDPNMHVTESSAETSPSLFEMYKYEPNLQARVSSPPLSMHKSIPKTKSLEELSMDVEVAVQDGADEKVDEDLGEEKSEESDSDEQEENIDENETKRNIPVSNALVDPIFVALNPEGSEGEGEAEPKSESSKVLDENSAMRTNSTKAIEKLDSAISLGRTYSHPNLDSYSATQSHSALSLHLKIHHRTTAHTRRRRRSASLSSICPLPLPIRRTSLHRAESLTNMSAFVPLLKRKKRSNIMDVAAPPARQPSHLPFSDTVVRSVDEGSSAEDGEESVEYAGIELDRGWEKVGKGWSAPIPDGRPQSWEGEWNLPDVKEVQRMLSLLR